MPYKRHYTYSPIAPLAWALALSALLLCGEARADWTIPPKCLTLVSEELQSTAHSLPFIELKTVGFGDLGAVIQVPAEFQDQLGIVSFKKISPYGGGGMGKAYSVLAELKPKKGKPPEPPREMIFKEVTEEHTMHEGVGAVLHNIAANPKDGPALHVMPVRAQFRCATSKKFLPTEVSAGILMEKGGVSAKVLIQPGKRLSLVHDDGTRRVLADREHLITALHGLSRFARNVSSALAELAAKKIVHRDIKPSNIVIYGGVNNTIEEVLAGTARFVVLDFGVAVPEGWSPTVAGTPTYIAPEIREGRVPVTTPAQDVYSLAVSIYEAMTGESFYTLDGTKNWTDAAVPAGKIRSRGQDSTRTEIPGQAAFEADPANFQIRDPRESILSPAKVFFQLKRMRKELEALNVPETELKLFDELADFTVKGLNPDPRMRMNDLAAGNSILHLTPDGKAIAGPKP